MLLPIECIEVLAFLTPWAGALYPILHSTKPQKLWYGVVNE